MALEAATCALAARDIKRLPMEPATSFACTLGGSVCHGAMAAVGCMSFAAALPEHASSCGHDSE